MPSAPELALATEPVAFDGEDDPLLVDPDEGLLEDAVDAWCGAAPTRFSPDLEALRAAARAETDPLDPPGRVPTLGVLATDDVLAAVTREFHAASRVAALVEAGVLDLRVLERAQPNPVLAGAADGFALVESDAGHYRVGADASLRSRYDDTFADAERFPLRTPSRHRVYDAFYTRCEEAVADEMIRLLDADPDLARGDVADVVGVRVRPYLVGARHGVDDHTLRRACEDAGLGSPSTFTRVKRRLVDAGLVGTETVPQPVGRPRNRLVAGEALADVPAETALDVAREALDGDA